MSEVFHNLSMQALRRSNDAVLTKSEAITELAKNINYLFHTKILEFKKQNLKIKEESNNKMNSSYQKIPKTDVQLIEENAVESIVNNEKVEYPDDYYDFPMPHTASEIEKERKKRIN